MEPHLLHTFAEDFYGQELRLVVCGYLRPELNFASLEALMAAIHGDIAQARARLESGGAQAAHAFLQPPPAQPPQEGRRGGGGLWTAAGECAVSPVLVFGARALGAPDSCVLPRTSCCRLWRLARAPLGGALLARQRGDLDGAGSKRGRVH